MSNISFLCMVILVFSLLFALTYIYFGYNSFFNELNSILLAFIHQISQKPVPLQNKTDEFGLLASSMQGMIERMNVLITADNNTDKQ